MNCTNIQARLDDYIDNGILLNERTVIELHINNCMTCKQHFDEIKSIRNALKALPIPEVSADFESRMFAHVRKHQAQKNTDGRFISGFATAIAASVFFWIAGSALFEPQPLNPQNVITVAMNESRPVRLLFDAPDNIQQVTLSIELPANIELKGYPGSSKLSWNTRLKKGQNVLSLPINAIQAGKGELVAHLRYGDKQKSYRLMIKTTDNGVMTYQIQPLTSA
ncbi:hypothetical protein MNBD_GAMMA07-1466 [hydrothermal vent metagenome]|uniref:Zinc-finger domain-containing protein n=1 Tax=hydrothermal vent metagenome TaxID=652676 RepID=A0A3B0WM05_9ZZZZ